MAMIDLLHVGLSQTFSLFKNIYIYIYIYKFKKDGFPCGPVVKTLPFNARGAGFIPGQGAKIRAMWPKFFKKLQYLRNSKAKHNKMRDACLVFGKQFSIARERSPQGMGNLRNEAGKVCRSWLRRLDLTLRHRSYWENLGGWERVSDSHLKTSLELQQIGEGRWGQGNHQKRKSAPYWGPVISSRGWAPCMTQSTHCPEPLLNTNCVPAGMTDISPEMPNARVSAYVETRWPRGEKIDLKMQTGEGGHWRGWERKV